ncbi:hypothetical protein GCK32_020137, partial [Trichostrongylus colubriformis]
MEHIQKYALDRAVQRLQNAINNIDRTLLEELPTDGDPEQVSQRVSARRRALTALHLVLTREVDSSSSTWESVMQSALTVEEDHVRRALINEYQAHWATIGGVEAENTIHELILLVEAALHLLPQEHAATIASTPLRPTMYTGSRSITSFAHRVTPTPGEVPPQARGRHPEGETTSEELAQPSADSPKSENIVPSNLPSAELPSHTLQEQLKLGEQESNVFVMRIIREKFPSRTLEYVGHQQAQDEATWGVSQLLDALDSSIRTFEAIEDSAHRGNLFLVRLVGDGRADHHRAPVEASLVAQ